MYLTIVASLHHVVGNIQTKKIQLVVDDQLG